VIATDPIRAAAPTVAGKAAADHAGAEFLFNRDGAAWGKSHQQRPLAEACRVAKITPAASFHTLRHTYASQMIMDVVPLMVVARNLGHADTRMVEKHYGHLATSYVREAIRAAKPLGIGDTAKVVPIAGAHYRGAAFGKLGIVPRSNVTPL
jgi:integrase